MSDAAKIRIAVVGTRGIPDIAGGVETHCRELYSRLSRQGMDITLFRRKGYARRSCCHDSYEGIKLIDLPAPRIKSMEAIVHTFFAICYARKLKADIVHIHGIGPALLTPLAKLLGMKTVVTHHGFDYNRSKWGRAARFALRSGEKTAAAIADAVISISPEITRHLKESYSTKAHEIPNGVARVEASAEGLTLPDSPYVLAVGRFVKEKNFDLLIKAFASCAPAGWQLVIAGDCDHPDAYSRELRRLAERHGVILTGNLDAGHLAAVRRKASLFALPSTHEGLPIALLEAMADGLDVVVSDIEACRLPQLEAGDFFRSGDAESLALALRRKMDAPRKRLFDMRSYDWDSVAGRVAALYRSL